jgi:lipopolysaccharide/colanic/teichoic acid biosynthesis glycosyltransferase
VIASLGIVLLLPAFIVIGILIKCDTRGPIFYRQARVGKNREIFKIFKFRTMVFDESRKRAALTLKDDDRVTRVGKVLRRLKIDELPQLFNVIMGDMGFVGPRPEVPEYADLIPEQELIYRVRPGMTDPASILYRNENDLLECPNDATRKYIQEILPKKVRINLEYMQKQSLTSDMRIMVKTMMCMWS